MQAMEVFSLLDQVIESELRRHRFKAFDGRRGDIEGPGRRWMDGDQGPLVEQSGGVASEDGVSACLRTSVMDRACSATMNRPVRTRMQYMV